MTFKKYSMKTQIFLGLMFTPLNFLLSYLCSEVFHFPLLLDMVFVFAASCFGVTCGIIVGVLHTVMNCIIFPQNPLTLLYSLCCITGTLLTWFLVTRHDDFTWIRAALLIFLSTIIISFEGSWIYFLFFSKVSNYKDVQVFLVLTYYLIMQNLGVQLSAFLARLPVNLFDKTISVIAGFLIFSGVQKIIDKIKTKTV